MKNLLIIYPHWPPSNLAGVHRPRLIANFLPEYGWHPIVLTVHPDYYEEPHDWDLCKTVSDKIEVHQTKAYKVTKPRVIGDIGLRAFPFLYRKALQIIRSREIDFIWIPIPSFYTALLGRLLHWKTKTPYGIDYIDPWVRDISGRKDWRHRLSNTLAKVLEPIAIKKAALITGVAEEYYMPALLRNFRKETIRQGDSSRYSENNFYVQGTAKQINLPRRQAGNSTIKQTLHIAFPYGFDPHDHEIELENIDLPWKDIPDCKPLVYAGAFLPNSRQFVETLFKSIRGLMDEGRWDQNIRLFFLGTGPYPGKSIVDYAKEYGIEPIVEEIRRRFPFLHILHFLSKSYAVMVIGSTEKHYTASKVFQAILSRKPVFAILHGESTAYQVLQEVQAGKFSVYWSETIKESELCQVLVRTLIDLFEFSGRWHPNYPLLYDKYSSFKGVETLCGALNELIPGE